MLLDGLTLLIVALLVVTPLVRGWREQALAERLERTRDPREAAAMVDAAMAPNRSEERTFRDLKSRLWPWLFG